MSQPSPAKSADRARVETRARQDQFIEQHLRRIFLIIYRIVGNVPDSQDLTQETFIKALQRQDQLKEADKAAHWLSRIATNTAIDFVRRNGRVAFTPLDDVADPISAPGLDSPEALMLRAEQQSHLERGLQRLTPRERAALVLRDIEDMPAEEVAEVMNCGKATVRSHIANARVKFRRFLERQP
ncbi:MAG: sigma-70 family RNA polymerase sigma factor [Bryobacterales bacterium]|nr:sigma-70 family RNA polymerase sigma factor [Bryobacterales bacterium]